MYIHPPRGNTLLAAALRRRHQPATTGLQINRHRDGARSRLCAGCRLAGGPGASTALGGLVVLALGGLAHNQPSTPPQSINPAPAFSRGWIFSQPNLPAEFSFCGF
jgi:hypothetical protein